MGLLHRVSAIWREKIHEGSGSVRDGLQGEAFSLARGTGRGFWTGGLAQLKGRWGSFTLRAEWHSRQRESQQEEEMGIAVTDCVTGESSARLE